MTILAWLGRQGTRAIAAVVLIAIVVPPVDAVLKPYVSEAIFALLCIAFIRVDTAQLRGHLERPGLVLAATAWTSLAIPALIAYSYFRGKVQQITNMIEIYSTDLIKAIQNR